MTTAAQRVGPPWPPPSLQAYDYLAFLARRDWAWEGLRRNAAYQAQALAHLSAGHSNTEHLEGGALLTRLQEPVRPAEAWALCTFRRPHAHRLAGPPRLAAGKRCLDTLCRRKRVRQCSRSPAGNHVHAGHPQCCAHPDRRR
ncbi:MAG: DUF6499 domain-containing protein [Hyphomicrobiaceae bacterium]